jgi:hypothetical protein
VRYLHFQIKIKEDFIMASSKNPTDAPAVSAQLPEVVQAGEAALIANTDAAVTTTAIMAGLAGADAPTPARATATPPDVSGPGLPSKAYGEFIKEVGMAVAMSQKALDENSKDIALALAGTEVPALIALNQVVNEDGEIESVTPLIQLDAKLIQYIQPTFYQWSRVTLFARFNVKSFQANADTHITSNVNLDASGSGNVSAGFFKGSANAQTNFNSQVDTKVDASFATAESSGSSYLLAVLEPRTDTRFPPPIIAVQGPRLRLIASRQSVAKDDTAAVTLDVTLFKKTGFSGTSKTVELDKQGPGTLSSNEVLITAMTGDDKRLKGTVSLTRAANEAAGLVTIRANLGTLTTSVTITYE